MTMRFERPYKGHSGWEVTLFGFTIFLWHKDQHKTHKEVGQKMGWGTSRRLTVYRS